MVFKNAVGHLRTVLRHKRLVASMCFRVGLYRQGLFHDMSKFSPTEWIPSVRYYQAGKASPVRGERLARGYSACWLHHKGRNRHHFEYWLDYSPDDPLCLTGMKMPPKYLAEMALDRIAACKVYHGEKYRPSDPLDYLRSHTPPGLIHPETLGKLEEFFCVLAEQGEEGLYQAIRKLLRDGY